MTIAEFPSVAEYIAAAPSRTTEELANDRAIALRSQDPRRNAFTRSMLAVIEAELRRRAAI
jgi:hypothetical protein